MTHRIPELDMIPRYSDEDVRKAIAEGQRLRAEMIRHYLVTGARKLSGLFRRSHDSAGRIHHHRSAHAN